VQTLKYRLKALGYQERFPFRLTTPFDKRVYTKGNCEKAVIAFKREHWLPATNIVDLATWRKLLEGTGIKP